jgi:hypothetical protein
MLFASPPSCQGPSLRTLYLNIFAASFLSFHHFVLDVWTRLLRWRGTQKRKSATTSLCWGTTHSPGITLQSKQACLSSLLARMKSIWLQCWPLLKVIRWDSLSKEGIRYNWCGAPVQGEKLKDMKIDQYSLIQGHCIAIHKMTECNKPNLNELNKLVPNNWHV